jgi:hypothetical protein
VISLRKEKVDAFDRPHDSTAVLVAKKGSSVMDYAARSSQGDPQPNAKLPGFPDHGVNIGSHDSVLKSEPTSAEG